MLRNAQPGQGSKQTRSRARKRTIAIGTNVLTVASIALDCYFKRYPASDFGASHRPVMTARGNGFARGTPKGVISRANVARSRPVQLVATK